MMMMMNVICATKSQLQKDISVSVYKYDAIFIFRWT